MAEAGIAIERLKQPYAELAREEARYVAEAGIAIERLKQYSDRRVMSGVWSGRGWYRD